MRAAIGFALIVLFIPSITLAECFYNGQQYNRFERLAVSAKGEQPSDGTVWLFQCLPTIRPHDLSEITINTVISQRDAWVPIRTPVNRSDIEVIKRPN
ncbi:hypothetical protein [uncultured Umboniibacter sp.]|uniref:hypothetical protein n=1 Tax=uncultured Umboniibacter sp. TaxID=1798917 RepID=UPI0026120E34|nr:hypothetical protein [uncultured Umboniibacter sp.]